MIRIRAVNFDRMGRELGVKGHRSGKMFCDELGCDPPFWENSATRKGKHLIFQGMVIATCLSKNHKVRGIQEHRKSAYLG
jgi:hypothetical protein